MLHASHESNILTTDDVFKKISTIDDIASTSIRLITQLRLFRLGTFALCTCMLLVDMDDIYRYRVFFSIVKQHHLLYFVLIVSYLGVDINDIVSVLMIRLYPKWKL